MVSVSSAALSIDLQTQLCPLMPLALLIALSVSFEAISLGMLSRGKDMEGRHSVCRGRDIGSTAPYYE